MITFAISAMEGPMSLIVSGHLGENGFGNGSHFSRCARQRYSLRHCRACKRWCDRTTAILLGDDIPNKDQWQVNMWAIINCPLLRPFEQLSTWTHSFCGFGMGSWAEWRLGPCAILLIHGPRPKWTWTSWGRTLAPPWFVLGSRERIKELERQRLPKKLNGCILGDFRDPLMYFSKGALRLTSRFNRHHYLSIRELRCAC